MSSKTEIQDFLTSRRARVQPAQVGLDIGSRRRVPGLRREEVALLAGVSLDYYVRLERGTVDGASDSVLNAIASALLLDETETAHLFDLFRVRNQSSRKVKNAGGGSVPENLRIIVDSITDLPAYIRNKRTDILYINPIGKLLLSELFKEQGDMVNTARYIFLGQSARKFYVNWERIAADCVATLRNEAGKNPFDKSISDLVGELSMRSEYFRISWASHNVKHHKSGEKVLNHPAIGQVTLNFESIEISGDTALNLVVYTASPGSIAADSLHLLQLATVE